MLTPHEQFRVKYKLNENLSEYCKICLFIVNKMAGVRIENVELVLKTDDAFIKIAVLVVWKTIAGIHVCLFR